MFYGLKEKNVYVHWRVESTKYCWLCIKNNVEMGSLVGASFWALSLPRVATSGCYSTSFVGNRGPEQRNLKALKFRESGSLNGPLPLEMKALAFDERPRAKYQVPRTEQMVLPFYNCPSPEGTIDANNFCALGQEKECPTKCVSWRPLSFI